MNPQPQIRLNKFLAERLGISRREADNTIVEGRVTVNGKPATLGTKITLPSADNREKLDFLPKLCYNNKIVPFQTNFLYLALHKPVGYVCSRRAQGQAPTIYELLPPKYQHLKTVGRLDKDSSGLILLTNDGDFAYQLTHPQFQKTKVYHVTLDHALAPLHQQMISDFGVDLPDGKSQFLVVRDEQPARTEFFVTLTEGRNRQIRRTFAALGYRVNKLHRLTFGPYEIGDLEPGETREIKK